MLTRAQWVLGSLALLALAANFLVMVSAEQRGRPAHGPGVPAEEARDLPHRASPAAAYRAFRQAQATLDWSREYRCYSPRQQVRFSHTIVVTALFLEFHSDLYLEVEAALSRHGLTDEDLADFWPKTVYEVADANVPDDSYADFPAEYEARLDRWGREIVPRIRDCAGLIATLQPLIREAARRSSYESTVALTVRQLEGYAYGRLREVRVDGDEATGRIRIKSRFGAFIVEPKCLEDEGDDAPLAGGVAGADSEVGRILLEDASGLYCWLWDVGDEIQTLARSLRHPRMVIVGLATGDVAVGPYELEMDAVPEAAEAGVPASEAEGTVLERIDRRDESEEVGLANNGTRTVTEVEVRFQRIGGEWFVDSIGCR